MTRMTIPEKDLPEDPTMAKLVRASLLLAELQTVRDLAVFQQQSGSNDFGAILGLPKDMASAQKIMERSLAAALRDISEAEIQQAQQSGDLHPDQAKALLLALRSQQLQRDRASTSDLERE